MAKSMWRINPAFEPGDCIQQSSGYRGSLYVIPIIGYIFNSYFKPANSFFFSMPAAFV